MNNVLIDSIAAPRPAGRPWAPPQTTHLTAQEIDTLIAIRTIQQCGWNAATLQHIVHAPHIARIIAMMPGTQATIQIGASIAAGLPCLLPHDWETDARMTDALHDLFTGACPGSWIDRLAHTATAGWGDSIADAIMHTVDRRRCQPGAAAALLGPSDSSARLLMTAWDAAFAIRRWGNAVRDNPAWWVHAISMSERRRVQSLVHDNGWIAASIVPWLPDAQETAHALSHAWIGAALRAYADASDAVVHQHQAIVRHLAAHAGGEALGDLARLALRLPTLWTIVGDLLEHAPSRAHAVTVAVPWDLLPERIRHAIMKRRWHDRTCAAIAHARGAPITDATIDPQRAVAFLSALDPTIWRQRTAHARSQWISATPAAMRYLAVRALGADIDALAWCGIIDCHVIRALRDRGMTDDGVRWHILPILLAALSPMTANAIIAALPTPPPNESRFHAMMTTRRSIRHGASQRLPPSQRRPGPDDCASYAGGNDRIVASMTTQHAMH